VARKVRKSEWKTSEPPDDVASRVLPEVAPFWPTMAAPPNVPDSRFAPVWKV
jgi:hypothetical protein